MDKAIDYIQGKIDSISQDIACKLHEIKNMPENEKLYNMALLQPVIDLHAELEALIKICAYLHRLKVLPIVYNKNQTGRV